MQAARKGKSKFVLCALQERVKTILHIARLDSFFTIAATVDEAVAK
jgi:anti-anti-sigma factor